MEIIYLQLLHVFDLVHWLNAFYGKYLPTQQETLCLGVSWLTLELSIEETFPGSGVSWLTVELSIK